MVTEHEVYKFENQLVYVSQVGVSKKGNNIVFFRNILNPATKGIAIFESEFLATAKIIGIKEVNLMLKAI